MLRVRDLNLPCFAAGRVAGPPREAADVRGPPHHRGRAHQPGAAVREGVEPAHPQRARRR